MVRIFTCNNTYKWQMKYLIFDFLLLFLKLVLSHFIFIDKFANRLIFHLCLLDLHQQFIFGHQFVSMIDLSIM